MDSFVENTGVTHQEKPVSVILVESEQIIQTPVENAEALLNEGSESDVPQEQDPVAITKPAPDEIKAGYNYAFSGTKRR